ncbi:MAG: flagellar assembly protein FliW [Gemmatimonadota bacterium]
MSALMAAGEHLTLDSALLGSLEIRADTVLSFPSGLPGFVTLRDFALVETQRDELVWLQSVDDPALTFLLADPFAVVPGFEIELPATDLAALGVGSAPDALLLLVVVQLDGGAPVSANLQSPIVIDRTNRRGRQVVLPDSAWGMHHPITIA